MNRFLCVLRVAGAVALGPASYASSPPAPSVLPECIIQYTSSSLLGTVQRVVLYEPSGTYAEISSISISRDGNATANAPQSGSFTYLVDTQNPQHASILTSPGSTGSGATDDLYFEAATSGSTLAPNILTTPADRGRFTYFPFQANSGGVNFSNRSGAINGVTSINGFVVAGNGPTWVLVRAVGAGLHDFGVTATAAEPSFVVYDGKGGVVGTSSQWGQDPNLITGYKKMSARVGAFPLADTSDEGVLILPLQPGAYTVACTVKSSGQLLYETYVLPFVASSQ